MGRLFHCLMSSSFASRPSLAASLFVSFRVPVAAVLVHFPLVSWSRPSMAAQMKTLLINFPQKTPNIIIKTHFLPLNVYNLFYNRLYLP